MSFTIHPNSRAAGSQLKYSSWKWCAFGITFPAFRTWRDMGWGDYQLKSGYSRTYRQTCLLRASLWTSSVSSDCPCKWRKRLLAGRRIIKCIKFFSHKKAISYVRIVADTLELLDHLVPCCVAVPHDTPQDLLHCDLGWKRGWGKFRGEGPMLTTWFWEWETEYTGNPAWAELDEKGGKFKFRMKILWHRGFIFV